MTDATQTEKPNIRGFRHDTTFSWPLVVNSDAVSLHYGKALTASVRRDGPIPVYGSNGVTGSHDTALSEGPTVILGRKGMGHLGVEWCDGPFWVIDTAYYVTFNREAVLPRFFYYYTLFVGLDHFKEGTSNPSLSRNFFERQPLPLPSLPEQREIVDVIRSFDDKIEANRRMNASLDALARAVFRDRFGRYAPGDALPAGWRWARVAEEFNFTMGQSPPGSTYNENGEGLPFYQGATDFGFRYPAVRKYCSAPTRLAKPGDTLVGVRAPVGITNMAREALCLGRGVAALRHKSGARSYT